MTWLLLPMKSLAGGKSRIASRIGPVLQRALNLELLTGALARAARYPGLDRTAVVSCCPEVLAIAGAHGTRGLAVRRADLNEELMQAVRQLDVVPGEPLLILSCDVPLARDDDLRALFRPREVVIATDRSGDGTNALCLPAGSGFRLQYGAASRQLHVLEAARLGLRCEVVRIPSLAFDLDTFDDYCEWKAHHPSIARWALDDEVQPLAEEPCRPGGNFSPPIVDD